MLELILTRVCVLAPLYILGFSEAAMNGYIPIVGFQAVFNHANVHLPWGPLKYVIAHRISTTGTTPPTTRRSTATTPRTIAFLDYLFGTVLKSKNRFPERYGVVGDYMPDGFIRQQLFPFRRSKPGDDSPQWRLRLITARPSWPRRVLPRCLLRPDPARAAALGRRRHAFRSRSLPAHPSCR